MRLTDWERDRLLVYMAAELARRHRARGLPLAHPEAVAIICDDMFEAARAGASYAETVNAGYDAVREEEVLDGVRELLDEVRLEVLMGDGTRVVVLVDPLGGRPEGRPDGPTVPPWVRLGGGPLSEPAGRETTVVTVRNASARPVVVSSHYPFHRVSQALVVDRDAVQGFRLDLPAGASVRWGPGETREVTLVRYGGTREP